MENGLLLDETGSGGDFVARLKGGEPLDDLGGALVSHFGEFAGFERFDCLPAGAEGCCLRRG